MDKIGQEELQIFVSNNVINPFYEKRLAKLQELSLNKLLKRKNPYLFKAKNILTAEELIKYLLDAFLSSQEETIFGNLMEDLAIFVCSKIFDGQKAEKGRFKSIDLIFNRDAKTYVVSIKSGPSWGNKDQIDKMKDNFINAKNILQSEGVSNKIIAVNGCTYGGDNKSYKPDSLNKDNNYFKLCGQEFWELITADTDFYQKIVVPIDKESRKKDETQKEQYSAKINQLTRDFSENYLSNNGEINWKKLIDFVSKKS
ncbi:MAG: methylase N-4/N-6 domain protein [Parcubacteria group bacterium GW2011_GWA1_38_7]|nr:MAG: methylase N-4/N-6 domain protein [Parcubacteria group bacterium GW2011_GWA1_38_7]